MYLNPDRIPRSQQRRVVAWMRANGCRDQIALEPIIVHGNVVEYRALCRVGREASIRVRNDEAVTYRRRLRVRVGLGRVKG